ncbi:unnamed protein product [Protopolystoma xenopodis]|uniref:Uncharacterized protein n=1 Tax=Protopolystoma xenopodis TaxID=117903 RepID=A0A448WAZ1_9PLAT|nr:unnamed protein product [Protopolystoma xenopodis]
MAAKRTRTLGTDTVSIFLTATLPTWSRGQIWTLETHCLGLSLPCLRARKPSSRQDKWPSHPRDRIFPDHCNDNLPADDDADILSGCDLERLRLTCSPSDVACEGVSVDLTLDHTKGRVIKGNRLFSVSHPLLPTIVSFTSRESMSIWDIYAMRPLPVHLWFNRGYHLRRRQGKSAQLHSLEAEEVCPRLYHAYLPCRHACVCTVGIGCGSKTYLTSVVGLSVAEVGGNRPQFMQQGHHGDAVSPGGHGFNQVQNNTKLASSNEICFLLHITPNEGSQRCSHYAKSNNTPSPTNVKGIAKLRLV